MFQISVKGFGNQVLEVTEFEKDKQLRVIPRSKMFGGGHRAVFSTVDGKTRIEHELETVLKRTRVSCSTSRVYMSCLGKMGAGR